MFLKEAITGAEHVVRDPDGGGASAGVLIYDRQMDLLQGFGQRSS